MEGGYSMMTRVISCEYFLTKDVHGRFWIARLRFLSSGVRMTRNACNDSYDWRGLLKHCPPAVAQFKIHRLISKPRMNLVISYYVFILQNGITLLLTTTSGGLTVPREIALRP